MECELEFYLAVAAITLSLSSGSVGLATADNHIGPTQNKRLELLVPNMTLNETFYAYPFECQISGLTKDEIDDILAGSSENMAITIVDGNNDTFTFNEKTGEQIYNVELKAVSNTLFVRGKLNNSDSHANGSVSYGCEVVFQEPEKDNDKESTMKWAQEQYRPSKPRILTTYNHVVLMHGAPEQVISCTAQGYPRPEIRWFSYDPNVEAKVLLEKISRSINQVTSYLLFSQVSNETGGNYSCLAENDHGRVDKTFQVQVISVEAINPNCNDLEDTPFSNSNNELNFKSKFDFQEVLRRAKRHLWYQWRGQKIYTPPYNKPVSPPKPGLQHSDLQLMVNYMAERLNLADKVAVNKWDNNLPIEDLPREQSILENMVRQARSRGLEASWARSFFRDQIEANKDIQHELIAIWRRSGRRPPGPPVDLGNEVRPKIDEINEKLLELAVSTKSKRSSWECSEEIEKNARLASFIYNLDPLHQKALQRATGNMCLTPVASPHSPSPYHPYPPPLD